VTPLECVVSLPSASQQCRDSRKKSSLRLGVQVVSSRCLSPPRPSRAEDSTMVCLRYRLPWLCQFSCGQLWRATVSEAINRPKIQDVNQREPVAACAPRLCCFWISSRLRAIPDVDIKHLDTNMVLVLRFFCTCPLGSSVLDCRVSFARPRRWCCLLHQEIGSPVCVN